MPANQSPIPTYTAADLLRYATGGMTASEMHAVEKAALEDPFLAEALDGYREAAANQPLANLQTAINNLPPQPAKQEKAKVVPLWRRRTVQIAVVAALITGASWWIVSLLLPGKTDPNTIAAAEQPAKQDTLLINAAPSLMAADSSIAYQPQVQDTQFQSLALNHTEDENRAAKSAAPFQLQEARKDKTLQNREAENADTFLGGSIAANQSSPAPITPPAYSRQQMQDTVSIDQREKTGLTAAKAGAVPGRSQSVSTAPTYLFQGRLTDDKNNPLPFANVMIVGQNVGTYTDADGRFNLISEDSLLPVHTRSVGYVGQNLTLKPGERETRIVMPEDEKLKESVALEVHPLQKRTVRANRTIVEQDSLETVAVQPTVGFADYSLYLLNNNRISELPQLNRQVKLSFEVDTQGNVKNITVEQSSGKALDEEAIRLIKEGPKWQPQKGKKGKGSVTVKF
jgi:TonB family protein